MAAKQTVQTKTTKTVTTRTVKRGIPAVIPTNAIPTTSTGGGSGKRGRPKGSKDKKPRKKRS